MKKISILAILFLSLTASGKDFYNLRYKNLKGEEVFLSDMKGKAVLIVNTASRCGYTSQFEQLQQLYTKYQKKGLEIIGFPSNDFKQEDLTGESLKKFCKLNYGVTFPLAARGSVIGENKNEVYKFLVSQSDSKEEVKWNFEKFLIDRKGSLVARYLSAVSPNDVKVISAIESTLGKK